MYSIFFRRLLYVALFFTVVIFITTFVPRILNPTPPSPEDKRRNEEWVDTSPHWLDRQACRWISVCGVLHVKWDPPALPEGDDSDGELRRLELRTTGKLEDEQIYRQDHSKSRIPNQYDKKKLNGIPDYVLKYAPLVHLYSGENFWPSDIADHIEHMLPYVDNTQINETGSVTLQNLHDLDSEPGFVYLKSEDDVETRPKWLHSRDNTPDPFKNGVDISAEDNSKETKWLSDGTTWYEVDKSHPLRRVSDPRKRPNRGPNMPPSRATRRSASRKRASEDLQHPISLIPQHKPDSDGYSRAPATLILVDKGSGIVDAFWFFFYAYNLGQTVLSMRFGNHVGDWEHAMVRFESGVPRGVFFSEHEGGQAYSFSAVEKRLVNFTTAVPDTDKSDYVEEVQRPVIYSAVGSHAMYATPGNHPYVLPFGMLKDVTDRGPLWDPSKNIRSYWYDYTTTNKSSGGLEPTAENPDAETGWFHYAGTWGDKLYGLDDARQYRLFGQYHYVTGPDGPKFKNLGRERVCQIWRCRIIHSLEEGRKKTWAS